MIATSVLHSQTGEKNLFGTSVPRMGLGVSLSRSVITNASPDATRSAATRATETYRDTVGGFYGRDERTLAGSAPAP